MPDDHSTDKARMEARDRAQPTRLDRAANLRADGDAVPDEDERAALLEAVAAERDDATEDLAAD